MYITKTKTNENPREFVYTSFVSLYLHEKYGSENNVIRPGHRDFGGGAGAVAGMKGRADVKYAQRSVRKSEIVCRRSIIDRR